MAGPALWRLEQIERVLVANEASAADAWRFMAEMSSSARTSDERLQLEARFASFKQQLLEMQDVLAAQRTEVERLRAEAQDMARAAADQWGRHPPPRFVLAVRALLAAYL